MLTIKHIQYIAYSPDDRHFVYSIKRKYVTMYVHVHEKLVDMSVSI